MVTRVPEQQLQEVWSRGSNYGYRRRRLPYFVRTTTTIETGDQRYTEIVTFAAIDSYMKIMEIRKVREETAVGVRLTRILWIASNANQIWTQTKTVATLIPKETQQLTDFEFFTIYKGTKFHLPTGYKFKYYENAVECWIHNSIFQDARQLKILVQSNFQKFIRALSKIEKPTALDVTVDVNEPIQNVTPYADYESESEESEPDSDADSDHNGDGDSHSDSEGDRNNDGNCDDHLIHDRNDDRDVESNDDDEAGERSFAHDVWGDGEDSFIETKDAGGVCSSPLECCDGLRLLFGESNAGDGESKVDEGEVSIDSHASFVDWDDLGSTEDDENVIGETDEDSFIGELLNDSHGSSESWDGLACLFREENGIGEGENSFVKTNDAGGVCSSSLECCDGLRLLFGESNGGDDESSVDEGEVSIDSHASFVDWDDLGCLEEDENVIDKTEDSLVGDVLNDHASFELWDGLARLFREENGIGEGENSFASEDEGPGDSDRDENGCGQDENSFASEDEGPGDSQVDENGSSHAENSFVNEDPSDSQRDENVSDDGVVDCKPIKKEKKTKKRKNIITGWLCAKILKIFVKKTVLL